MRLARLERRLLWDDLDARDARIIGLGSRRALGDPLGQKARLSGIGLEPLAALGRDLVERFEQQQAMNRIGRIDPAALRAARDRAPVALVVIPAE